MTRLFGRVSRFVAKGFSGWLSSRAPLLILSSLLAASCALSARGAQPGDTLWVFPNGGGHASPAIGPEGTVYAAASDGNLYALAPTNGQLRWKFPTGSAIGSSPALDQNGRVYVISHNGTLFALNAATGQEIWRFAIDYPVVSSPAVGFNGLIYFGAGRAADMNTIYAVDAASGQKVWEFKAGLGQDGASSPAIGGDGTVYVGAVAKVFALNGATGQERWSFATGGFVGSSPALGLDGAVYVGSDDGKVYALDGSTGQQRWLFTTVAPGVSLVRASPAVGNDGAVYVGSYGGDFYALDGATGRQLWAFPTGGSTYSSPAIGADGTVYVGSDLGKLYALDGATGLKRWEAQTGSAVHSSPAIGPDGIVYFASLDQQFYAIQGSSGPAASAWPKFRQDLANRGNGPQKPRIQKEPPVAVLKEGQEGRITVQVAGVPAPTFQWRRNEEALPGATNLELILQPVTRADEGSYWVVASNLLGSATSAPIPAVVSNVDPQRFVGLRWPGQPSTGLTLESTEALGPNAIWHSLSNYPPAAVEQTYAELRPRGAGFYRLSSAALPPQFTVAATLNGWVFNAPTGARETVELVTAASGWKDWLVLTNLVLPTSPWLFLDYDSLGQPERVYRTTPGQE